MAELKATAAAATAPSTSAMQNVKAAAKTLNETPSLEASSGVFGFVFMTFFDKLFATGYKRTLTDSDLGGISAADRSDLLYARFGSLYAAESQSKTPAQRSLWGVLWKTVGIWKLYLALFLFCLSAALQFGPVMILTRLVRHLQGTEQYDNAGLWAMICLLFIFPVIGSISLAHSNAIMAHLGAQIRNVLICAIYRKALRISPAKKLAISSGRIITMFSDDTNQIRSFLFFMTNSICAPLQVAACLYLIYGPSCLAVAASASASASAAAAAAAAWSDAFFNPHPPTHPPNLPPPSHPQSKSAPQRLSGSATRCSQPP